MRKITSMPIRQLVRIGVDGSATGIGLPAELKTRKVCGAHSSKIAVKTAEKPPCSRRPMNNLAKLTGKSPRMFFSWNSTENPPKDKKNDKRYSPCGAGISVSFIAPQEISREALISGRNSSGIGI